MNRERNSLILMLLLSFVVIYKAFNLQIINGGNQEVRAEQNRFRIKTIKADRGIFYDRKGNALVENGDFRRYLYSQEMAHILGYLGEADESELSFFSVDLGESVGKAALEKEYNNILKGENGGEVEEYSAMGEKLRSFSRKESRAGTDIQLNIDKDLQILAYELLAKEDIPGAIVISKTDGRILALVSYPSFDTNLFSRNLVDEQVDFGQLFSNERLPLFDRAIAGTYPPASTFKIVTSLAALEEGVIDENYIVEDTGKIELGGSTFTNWYFTGYGRTDGMVDVVKAMQRSNDIFYYKVGGELGINRLASWARKLGLESTTGIEIEGEVKGLVPDEKWKQETWNENWYSGETYITAIGQGNLLVTPMQINRLTNVVANDGYLCRSRLVMGVNGEVMNFNESFNDSECVELGLDKNNIGLVREGMKRVCESRGTAWPFFDFKVKNEELSVDGKRIIEASGSGVVRPTVGCKTGTGETGKYEEIDGEEIQILHAWFTAFSPAIDPEISVTVILEGGGQGSDKPALMTKEIMKKWFEEVR